MDPRLPSRDNGQPQPRGDVSRPDRPLSYSSAPQAVPPRDDQQNAAANVIRSQINALFGNPAAQAQPEPQPQQQAATVVQPVQQQPVQQINQTPSDLQDTNPYDRVHQSHPQPQEEQWKTYHSAWQNYYQKYYEGYYAHHASQQTPQQQQGAPQEEQPQNSYFTQQVEHTNGTEDISKDEALFELRQKLLGNVRSRAAKVRKSRHFMPIIASLSVMLVLVFLQYNQVLFATVNAYVTPGAIDPQNIVIDPAGGTAVSEESRLIIPKINVDVPAIYDVGNDHASQMKAMEGGVAHFAIPGASSRPGEIGNTVLSGHSSNDLFDPGDYKFIFAQLEKLKVGDTVYANYKGVRYTYVITGTEVVKPTEVSKLVYDTDKPIMTLITCTPLGTSRDRLLVTAEQVSPDPAKSAPAPSSAAAPGQDAPMPGGSSPTVIERLFGAR